MSRFIIAVLLAVCIIVPARSQSFAVKEYHPFTGTMTFGVDCGVSYASTDYPKMIPDYTGRTLLEYYFPLYSKSVFGLRASGGMGYFKGGITGTDTSFRTAFMSVGAGVVYGLMLGRTAFPYLAFGADFISYAPKNQDGVYIFDPSGKNYKKNELTYSAEFGTRFLISDDLSLNFSVAAHISPDDKLDGKISGITNDMYYTGLFGVSIAFFGGKDTDGDGVEDNADRCPDTPLRVKVDAHGCPVDSDKDGIPDYLDMCPDTPEQVKVDRKGCPVDADGDGIPDYIDICPATPRGVQVDEYGCPKDSDGDGVPDYLDNCPNTPKSIPTDKNGCPVDSDGDGVPDYLDNCPGTPFGTQVDNTGCPLKKEQTTREIPALKDVPVIAPSLTTVLSGESSFLSGQSKLQPAILPELDKLVQFMKENPQTSWIIEGHTDNKGNYDKNKKISLDRATAVMKYFESKGISKSRFSVRGLGSDFPAADNATEEGRLKNRRVVILRAD